MSFERFLTDQFLEDIWGNQLNSSHDLTEDVKILPRELSRSFAQDLIPIQDNPASLEAFVRSKYRRHHDFQEDVVPNFLKPGVDIVDLGIVLTKEILMANLTIEMLYTMSHHFDREKLGRGCQFVEGSDELTSRTLARTIHYF